MRLLATAIILLVLAFTISVKEKTSPSIETFHGFTIEGKAINPSCIKLLQTSMAERSTIIIRSLILETCQDSNLAFAGQTPSIGDQGNVSFTEKDDPRSGFFYRVLGKLRNGDFVLFHNGYIGIYRIESTDINFDFLRNETRPMHVLTKITDSWVPCFTSAEIKGNTIKITKQVYDSNAPTASQCTGQLETIAHSF